MEVLAPEDLGLPEDAPAIAVLAADRSAYCAISTKQGRVFANPVDPLMAGGEKDDNELEVDAAYCELAAYPAPAEVTDDCNGTNLGFKGGTLMLTADSFAHGGCRIGLTPMEAEFTAGDRRRGRPPREAPSPRAGTGRGTTRIPLRSRPGRHDLRQHRERQGIRRRPRDGDGIRVKIPNERQAGFYKR